MPLNDPVLDAPRRFTSECVLSTVGPDGAHDGQPCTDGPLSFAWDGTLEAYPDVFEPLLFERLSPESRRKTALRTPAALLFATWLDHLGGRTDDDGLADALERMVGALQDVALTQGLSATFGIVASNGQCLVTLRTGTDAPLPPLYTLASEGDDSPLPPTGRIIASEPTFPGPWISLDPHSLTIFTMEESVEGRDVDPE